MKKLQTITLKSGNYSCEILPNYGAALQSYKYDSQEFVQGYTHEEEVLTQKYRGVLLAPFPNRLAKAKYTFLGKEYSLPVNRDKEGLALHGFLYDKVFKVESCNQKQAELSYTYDSELEGYPFAFKLTVTYTLHDNGTLKICTYVKNRGKETIPFGIGWHPYFTMNQSIDNMQLRADAMQQLVLNDKKLPTGERLDFMTEQGVVLLEKYNFDDCFYFVNTKNNIVSLQNDDYSLDISMSSDDYPYVQIYTPKTRNAVAIEPMTCPPNAFNSGEELWQLESAKERSATYNIRAY